MHNNSQARFNPDEWQEAVIILDECEQVIWHMLDSPTCQKNRVAIIENFQHLLATVLSTGGKIYLSDADLSRISLEYINNLTEIPVQTYIVDNVYRPSQRRKLISYSGNDPRALMLDLVKAIENGNKTLIHTSGQKVQSKWGSINLESYLKHSFPDLKILRIDSQSVSDPKHPAYGCIRDLNSILGNYDIVIASPVIETGVSIDLKNHFDSVWCVAYGIQTVDAVRQTIARLRDDVPRHIWVKKTAKGNCIGDGSTSVKALLRAQHKITQANISLLRQADLNELETLDFNFSDTSLKAWAQTLI